MHDATRQLTLDLAAIPSVNGTPGEAGVVEYLHHRLTHHPAYRDGRMKVYMVPAVDDPLSRPVLIAHMPGSGSRGRSIARTDRPRSSGPRVERGRTPLAAGAGAEAGTGTRPAASLLRTAPALVSARHRRGVLLFGHIDTVGTADFGALEALAFRPAKLTEEAKHGALGPQAARRARSGHWLFGRGVLDMKSGVAAALTAFETLAARGTEADLFFSATPDEEVGSLGVKTLAAWLREFLPEQGIAMQAAINTDYTSWQAGDHGARHIYLGSIGKLLPAVYVRGLPSHAAEPERGLDPNLIVAAITTRVVYNNALRDAEAGELCPYPVCLRQRDDKAAYDVQTSVSASAYYNLFHMQRSPGEQLERLTAVIRDAVADVQTTHPEVVSADIPVLTFGELWDEAAEDARDDVRTYANSLTLSQDLRERCRLIVERLLGHSSRRGPFVVVYFANGLVPKVNSGQFVRSQLERALAAFERETGESFAIHRYFPYISDLSFLTPSPDWEDDDFRRNFPSVHTASPAPRRDLPTLMVGPYGTSAHQPDECVETNYSFGRLPLLLTRLVEDLGSRP